MAGLVQAYAAQLVTIFVGVHISIFAWLAVNGMIRDIPRTCSEHILVINIL